MTAYTYNRVCRTCLSTGLHRSLFDSFDVAINAERTTLIYQIIMECSSVKIVQNDNLPTGICEDCICSLKQAYAFKKLCENSDASFRFEINHQHESQLYSKCGPAARDPCLISESAGHRNDSVFSYGDDNNFKRYINDCELHKHTESKRKIASLTVSANSTDVDEVSCTVSRRDNKPRINGIREGNVIKTEEDGANEDAVAPNCRKNYSKPVSKKYSKFRDNALKSECDNKIYTKNSNQSQQYNGFLVKTCAKSALDKSDRRSFVKNITEKSFACEACGRKFSKPEYVRRHSKVHTGECICHICKNNFSCSQALNFHIKCHSGEASSFMCDHCGKSYRSNAVLQNHMRHKHALSGKGKRPSYSCQICNKSFGYLRGLQDHSVRHGEKKCLCHVCGKPFVNRKELTKHSRVHTGLKPYECVTCGKTFAQKKNLKVHKLSHTEEKPIGCELCDRSFKLPQNLRDHMRTHTGEKPYACEICNKSFPYHKSLIVHRKTHRSDSSVCS